MPPHYLPIGAPTPRLWQHLFQAAFPDPETERVPRPRVNLCGPLTLWCGFRVVCQMWVSFTCPPWSPLPWELGRPGPSPPSTAPLWGQYRPEYHGAGVSAGREPHRGPQASLHGGTAGAGESTLLPEATPFRASDSSPHGLCSRGSRGSTGLWPSGRRGQGPGCPAHTLGPGLAGRRAGILTHLPSKHLVWGCQVHTCRAGQRVASGPTWGP